MIQKLFRIFGSKTKAQEIILLLHDVKPVVRQGYYEEELPEIELFCVKNKLHLAKSKFKVLLLDNDEYSNRGLRVKEDDKRRGMHFVYISKDEEIAYLAAYYELMNNHRDLGLILGYPQCCVDNFIKNFNENILNPELPPTNLFTNLSKRDEDCVLLSHFPCSSDCSSSIELGRTFLWTIGRVDKAWGEELSLRLTLPRPA